MAYSNIDKIIADFQCWVCGAIFTTDQDRQQHLEKEIRNEVSRENSEQDIERAKAQLQIIESLKHVV